MSMSRLRLPRRGRLPGSTTRSRARRITSRLAIAATMITGSALGTALPSSAAPTPAPPAATPSTLTVHASQPFRPVTHVASGALYGLDTGTIPADSLVEPLHPNTFVQMAPGGK